MKKFNNLYGSVLFLFITLLGFFIWFLSMIMLGFQEHIFNIHFSIAIIIYSLFMNGLGWGSVFIIFQCCFITWEIKDDSVSSKKLFQKRCFIKFFEIISITEEKIDPTIITSYKTNAIVIRSIDKVISIYLDKKITADVIKELLKIEDGKL